jgi:uncharacterized membrane protein YagU involved in acid resistance
MYCCEDWIVIDYVKICIVFAVCMYILCDLFWRLPIWEATKIGFI